MTRETIEMSPTPLRRARGQAGDYDQLQRALGGLGEVRAPGKAEEPILAPSVRVWLYAWLVEIRAAAELAEIGLKPRSTAVLHGPPGCGKTTLAHHLAARLGLPMVVVGPETLVSSGLGDSERNMGRLFDVLRAYDAPIILFMDEIEALGSKRVGKDSGGGAMRAMDRALTVLLRKIETCSSYVIGATNRPEVLDPALWRRFDMQVEIDLPGADERFAILKRYGLPFGFSDDDIDLLTDLTRGASPALLRGLMEGVKRALIVWPRMQRDISDPRTVFAATTISLQPPPEIEPPPLWAGRDGIDALRSLAWPPTRE